MSKKKINKGAIPVLTNPRLNTTEYVEPMEVVLFTENKKEYKVKDLYNDHVLLKDKFNQLIDLLKNKEVK